MKKKKSKKLFKPIAKQNFKFENDFEIFIHKIVSSLSYGEEIIIPVNDDLDDYIYAIKKSGYYNCMDDLKILVSLDKTQITISTQI